LKRLLLGLSIILALVGCSRVKEVVVKDISLADQQALAEKYHERSAWTRGVLEDVGEGGSIPRDTKVKIVDIDMHYNGAVTVRTLQKRNRIRYALEIERPLTPEKIETKLDDLFWYQDPVIRQVEYIRKWGKKVARGIVDHEVFVGMPAEAARESWGVPGTINVNEIGGKLNEQWVYPTGVGKRNRYVYIIDGKVSKWEE